MSDFEKQVLRELRAIRNVLENMSGERSEMAENVNDPFRNIQDADNALHLNLNNDELYRTVKQCNGL